jgi:cytochrome c oxidase subunit IV
MNDAKEVYEQEHHIVSPVIYLAILATLFVATGLTVWASYVDLGEWHIAQGVTIFWNPVVALAIACTKGILVVLFFMHVKYSTKLTKLTVIAGFFIFRAWGRW